jgi:hypothetical protein
VSIYLEDDHKCRIDEDFGSFHGAVPEFFWGVEKNHKNGRIDS